MSAVRLCYAVVPHMVERGTGSIVATQSYSVKQPIDNLILSNSIRLAVIGLMKSLANELGPKGIRVNSINPAWTMTDRVGQLMADRAQRNKSSMEEEASKVYADVPLEKVFTKVSHRAEEESQALLVARDVCRLFRNFCHPDAIVPIHILQGA